MRSLVVFDLDGTLAESKSPLDAEMATLICGLLRVTRVAVISGGAWPQFQKQILTHLPDDGFLDRLSLLPTCGTKFYSRNGAWKRLYSEDFSSDDTNKIVASLLTRKANT